MEELRTGDGQSVRYVESDILKSKEEGQVRRQIQAIDRTTAELDARLGRLLEALEPVLEGPRVNPEEAKDYPGLVPLATHLYSINERLEEMASLLGDVYERLEL